MRRVALALILAAVWPFPLAAQTISPELPRAVPVATIPTATRVIPVAAGGDVQAALNGARGGDAVELACGASYTGSYTLPNRGADTGWVDVRAGCVLPPAGTRMTKNLAATFKLPRLISDGSNLPVLGTAIGANHYRILGLDIGMGAPGLTALIVLGSDAQTVLATIPSALILDRLYMHGTTAGELRRCVALNSAWTAIVESSCTEVHQAGSDNQAIMGWTGPGPYLIRNNYLEAASENIMFGGGDPRIVGLVPSDITIIGNHLTKPLAWQGGPWLIKNLFELKNASRVLVEGNVMENNWAAAQDGVAILLKSTNQEGTCTWCVTAHVTFRLNRVRNTPRGFNFAGTPDNPAAPMHDVSVTDNLVELSPGQSGALYIVQGVTNLTIARNTGVTASPMATLVFHGDSGVKYRNTGFRFTDNVTSASDNWGIFGDGTGRGLSALAVFAPQPTVTGNVFAGTKWGDLAAYATLYPPGNFFVSEASEAGLDPTSLVISTGSAFAGKGANVAAVLAATASAVTGTNAPVPTPTPGPVPSITLAQLRAAITAIDKVVGPTGRENAATKAALAPVAVYLHALLGATP